MMNPIKISVVIPAYNEEKDLGDCLESLKNQTLPSSDFETIVVDNNSTDKTAQIAQGYGVRVVSCQVQGVAAARAGGSDAVYGEIIASTDADTIVADDWLEKIWHNFENDSKLLGLTGPVYFKDINAVFSKLAYISFDIFQRFNFLIRKPTFSGSNYAVKTEAYKAVGGINPKLESAEGIDLSFRLSKKGKVGYFEDCIVHTSPRRLTKDPVEFFRHHSKNYFAMLRGKPPNHLSP